MSTKLLRIPEVASRLDVPLARAYEMARRGVLPVVRIGRQIRVHPDQLDEWIASGGTGLSPDSSSDSLVPRRTGR